MISTQLGGGTIIKNFIALMLVLLIITVTTSLAANKEPVTVSGSTTVLPLAEATAEAFNSLQQKYFVSVTGGGTGPGIIGIAERRIDIAMASREITEEEKERYGDRFQEYTIGYDGVALAVSKAIYIAGITGLTSEQVKSIYLGETRNWRALGGPDKEIYAIARESGSGTRAIFNNIILGNEAAETPGVGTVALSSAEVETAISGSDKAIGYLGLNYAEEGYIATIALDGVIPSIDSIRNGSYSLARKLYFYTIGEPKPGTQEFIDFVLSAEGQRIAEENGFIPLING